MRYINLRYNILWFAFLVGLILLGAGCSNLESSQPPELNSPSLQQSSTVAPQVQSTSTSSPVSEETATDQLSEDILAPSSIPQIDLGKSIEVVNSGIPGYGEWSPVEDRISFLGCDDDSSAFQLTLHNSPSFDSHVLYSSETKCDPNSYYDFSWNPNGKYIVFANMESPEYATTWVSDLSKAWQFEEEAYSERWVTYLGWMNNNVFIEGSYSGGGNSLRRFRNVVTSNDVGWCSYSGSSGKPNDKYFPVEVSVPSRHYVVAFSMYAKGDPFPPYSEGFEVFPISSMNISSDFMDWRNRTQYMLVRVIEEEEKSQASNLVFWNVDTGEIPITISDAVYGRVSSDGRWFVYMPFIFPENDSPYLKCETGETAIQIMDLWDQQVKYSLLVDYQCNWDEYLPYQPMFNFSPDGSRLAYHHTESNNEVIYVIDLSSNSPKSNFDANELSWSPSGRFVILRIGESDYSIYDLSSNKSSTLVKTSGDVRISFKWSPSETFIAVLKKNYQEPRETIIIKNPLLD